LDLSQRLPELPIFSNTTEAIMTATANFSLIILLYLILVVYPAAAIFNYFIRPTTNMDSLALRVLRRCVILQRQREVCPIGMSSKHKLAR